MKLPQAEIRNAESLGRNNLAAVGGVASAIGAKASAQSQALNQLGKVGAEFIRREETSAFKTVLTNTQNSQSKFIENEAVKESYTGQELEGRVKDVELYNYGADKNGKELKVLKKNIPAYKVYPELLANKLRGDMETYANLIPNPLDRKVYLENRSADIDTTVLKEVLKASREQYLVLRDESDARREDALANGNVEQADIEAAGFDGTDFEVSERLKDNARKHEVWRADELIRIEDGPNIKKMLNYLRKEDYKKQGGPLDERANVDLQNRLQSKLGSLKVRAGAVDKVYKEELRQAAQDIIKLSENGIPTSVEKVDDIRARLDAVDLQALSIDLRRADEKAYTVDMLYKIEPVQQIVLIDQLTGSSDSDLVKRDWLISKSKEIQREIYKDANGVYQSRNFAEKPVLNDPNFLSKSLQMSRQASKTYNLKAKPLAADHAQSLSDKFKTASLSEKTNFIAQALQQVPEKADREALFKQIDDIGDGNLNVYADIVERGKDSIIKIAEEGKNLRLDKSLKLIPKDMDANLNIELQNVFPIPIERQRYIEVVKDYYAKFANDAGLFESESINSTMFGSAVKEVIGNIVEYDGRKFLLPDNTLDLDSFDDWSNGLNKSYIDTLGGVENMESGEVLKNINNGELKLWPSTVRGEYLLKDARGQFLITKDPSGRTVNFKFIYNRNAPRKRSISWTEFKEGQ